ncbi:hypothetical protein [Methanococcoides sp.]|uniref:hypothetical protein n=1 Tax=Methanococcoides sp. TaxID=1966350 RepID=UPI00272E4770|nr:hypothetical protein [Methanococcoides sp.]
MTNFLKNTGIMLLIILLLFGYSDAAANETQNIKNLKLPDYGPHIFKEVQNEPGFISVRGKMPTIIDNKEKLEWTDKLVQCSINNKEMDKYYSASGGPVLSFGTSINGYLEVGCNSATPEQINESVINEIYQVIDEQCEKEGVADVPVVFIWTEMATEETPGFASIMLILSMLLLVKIRK